MRTLSRKSFAIGLLVALLVTYTGRAVPVYALAVGPLADPIYDTKIFAFKDYVEQNLDEPQLDIMFFLIGGLAVAQMGAQDAMLISPYPNEENVKEWIINCGIQLYNAVIGLVPSGDYYMGIPSIGTTGTKGIPRQVIKGLVAQMMGDAVVATNYPDLDTFLEENPNQILLPFNSDLQLGVNAVFGLNGGLDVWQTSRGTFSNFLWKYSAITSQSLSDEYSTYWSSYINYGEPLRANNDYYSAYNVQLFSNVIGDFHNIFIDNVNHIVTLRDDYGSTLPSNQNTFYYLEYSNYNRYDIQNYITHTSYNYAFYKSYSYNPSSFNTYNQLIEYVLGNINTVIALPISDIRSIDFQNLHCYVGSDWNNKTELFNDTTLGIESYLDYYEQLQNDYLFDLRGLMGDLVNYVYLNPIWDNIYDLVGNLVLPDRVKVSVDLTPITDLLAPPVPVNLNDVAELTDNTYLERVKEHARNAGDIFANYVAFWHNCDSDLVYTVFGAAILVLVGAFVGKWGHS